MFWGWNHVTTPLCFFFFYVVPWGNLKGNIVFGTRTSHSVALSHSIQTKSGVLAASQVDDDGGGAEVEPNQLLEKRNQTSRCGGRRKDQSDQSDYPGGFMD